MSDSDDEDHQEQLQYKIILLGDGAVGKTSIASRFTQENFTTSYKQTIGLDFFIKRVVLPGGLNVALQIWDIGGQQLASKMIKNYIRGAHAVLLCYDITNHDSFQNLEDWSRLVRMTFQDSNLPYMALVGNKCDLSHIRAVSTEKAHQFGDENQTYIYFMSAKSGDQVNACFYRIAAHLAGVVLTQPELVVANTVVQAQIVNHQRHDETVNEGKVPEYNRKGKGGCTLS